ncbi:MAPEG family protein [Xanthomonas fragariae]|uniref:MAPEG family protein n=1 Tax=Xanthomonas fragariae TaxID=48664 RepID=UPI001ABE1166|nr:MAPEG family protein [Xanthomonas fragariae]UKR51779.1 MAPEG family protein [Xanthomonas fragariae]
MELTTELQMLGWAMVLGVVQLLAASASTTAQRGIKWNASARDNETRPLTGVAARLERALRNYLETFPIFAAAVLAVSVAGRTSADTALGVQLYLWARVAYVPVYSAGIPYLRSAIWVVSFWGIVKLLRALLGW